MKLLNKLERFMRGRYGTDELYRFLFLLLFIAFIVNIFVKNDYIVLIEGLIIFLMFFRLFSKNFSKRRKENQLFLKIKKDIIKPYKTIKKRYADRKNAIYRKCKKCKTVLKLPLPSKRGKNTAICPECNEKVNLFTLRKQKIEVIRKEK